MYFMFCKRGVKIQEIVEDCKGVIIFETKQKIQSNGTS